MYLSIGIAVLYNYILPHSTCLFNVFYKKIFAEDSVYITHDFLRMAHYGCLLYSLINFPRCWKWAVNTRREKLQRGRITAARLHKTYHLCSVLFEESQFVNPKKKNRLIWSAVPTLFDVPNPLPK